MKITSFYMVWVFVVVANAAVNNSFPLDGKLTNSQEVNNPKGVFYMASIRLLKTEPTLAMWYHICGGCLISLRHILTAAQCIILINEKLESGFEDAAAFVGTLHLDDSTKPSIIQDMEYNNVYDPKNIRHTTGYDIGVILLEVAVKVSDVVNKVDLFHYEEDDVGIHSAYTMGWGALTRSSVKDVTYLRNSKLPSSMRYLILNMIEHHKCFRKLHSVLNMDEHLMCAGDEKTSEQNSVGDAGNPLIATYNNNIRVAGVASYIATGKRNHPNVFVNVKSHEVYIKEAMARLSLMAESCENIASGRSTNTIAAS